MERKYTPPASLTPGYFLGQEARSLPKNAFFRQLDPLSKPFLTEESAKRFFEQIAGKVDGLDYVNFWYESCDAEMARKIAEIGRAHDVDMWAGIRWCRQFRDMPPVPAEYSSWTMDGSGNIYPVLWEQRNHMFDYLNPEAVDWLLDVLEERYWPCVKGVVNGYLFPESRVPCEVPDSGEFIHRGEGVKTWTLHAYSPYVLERWRKYCAEHDVKWQGSQVDRFPVPLPHMAGEDSRMVKSGVGVMCLSKKNIYIPDNRPSQIPPFTRFADIPKGTEIWLAWENFLCELFHQSFVHRIAERFNRYNADNPDWRGVCFFNNDVTMLDYRNFKTHSARTDFKRGIWPQGRRMGVDIRRLLKDPEITCFISETVDSVRTYIGYEENTLSHFADLAKEYGRANDYGFLLHFCDLWATGDTQLALRLPGAGIMDDIEEDMRWEMFYKYRPKIFSFYNVYITLVPDGPWYKKETAERFWKRVKEYKSSFK